MNKLKGSRAYLAGPIDYCTEDGVAWRRDITIDLRSIGVIVLDPTEKPVTNLGDIPSEIGKEKERTKRLKESGQFDELKVIAKKIRNIDLRMTDISDFLIVYLDLKIPMCGTWEELFNANRQKKPIIVFTDGGPYGAPLWLHGTLDHNYIFHNLAQVKRYIYDINDGTVKMDGRWKLLDHLKL